MCIIFYHSKFSCHSVYLYFSDDDCVTLNINLNEERLEERLTSTSIMRKCDYRRSSTLSKDDSRVNIRITNQDLGFWFSCRGGKPRFYIQQPSIMCGNVIEANNENKESININIMQSDSL